VPSALTVARSSPRYGWAARASSDGGVRTPIAGDRVTGVGYHGEAKAVLLLHRQ
jgi:hypothetical protein